MLGHVNNVAIAAMHESGRVRYGWELAQVAPPPAPAEGFILARLEIDYTAELHYGTPIRVGAVLTRIGSASMDVCTGVFTDDDRCVSTARGVLVLIGPDGSVPIEGDFRAALEAELAT